jgi:hypothetical protein
MKKLLIIGLLIVSAVSCEDFEGWNIDKKHPGEVSGSYLVTTAQREMAQRMWSISVNYNIFGMLAQHWTETTYVDEANYDLVNRNIGGNFWLNIYTQVLANLEEAKKIITDDPLLGAQQKANQLAIIEIMEVYQWQIMVDTFGDIPYSEALIGIENLVPAYDNDADIYADLFDRIDAALATLNAGGSSFGGADLIYNGDVSNWKKFANTLKLRMAVRIADVDATTAAAKANEAINAGVINSASANAAFPFETNPVNANPMWVSLVQSGRDDFVVANTFVDVIAPLNDPRASVFMDDNKVPYIGGPYGANNTYGNYTHIGDDFHVETLPGILATYDETEFLIAEAIARGLVSGDAEAHYNNAVTASIAYWTGSSSSAAAYLAQPTVKYNAANWKKSIGVQKWISLFGRGFEAWASWRNLDYPAMNRPGDFGSDTPVPRRYIYPNTESAINTTNYEAASAAMGGDLLESRVFWDKGVGN